MHHQTNYALIKLTCHTCLTKDLGDTSEYMATKLGWTEIVESPQPHEQVVSHWWTHKGYCPPCTNNNIRRRKENPVSVRTMRKLLNAAMVITILAGVLALVMGSPVTAASSEPPPRPRPTDIGACCYGSGFPVTFSIKRWKCETGVNSPSDKPGLFVNGAVPTVDKNPCDILPGGD